MQASSGFQFKHFVRSGGNGVYFMEITVCSICGRGRVLQEVIRHEFPGDQGRVTLILCGPCARVWSLLRVSAALPFQLHRAFEHAVATVDILFTHLHELWLNSASFAGILQPLELRALFEHAAYSIEALSRRVEQIWPI